MNTSQVLEDLEIWLTHKEEDKKEKPKDWSNSKSLGGKASGQCGRRSRSVAQHYRAKIVEERSTSYGKNVFGDGQPLKRVEVSRAGMQRTLAGRYT